MKTTAIVRSALALALVGVVQACSTSVERGDSESHFLTDCSGLCNPGLECICGTCTRLCSATSACADLNTRAECADAPGAGCNSAGSICDIACLGSGACDALGSGYECVAGRCRHAASTPLGAGPASGGAASKPFPGGNGPGPSVFAVDVQAACATPDGQELPFTTGKELEALIVGDWLQCGPPRNRSAFGDGLRISADHTYYSLVQNAACGYDPRSTGFDGYGTWSTDETNPPAQFTVFSANQTGAFYFPSFTDTGRFVLDPSLLPMRYVRMPTTPDVGQDASCGVADGGQPN